MSVHAEVGEYLPVGINMRLPSNVCFWKDQGGGVVLSQIHEIDYLCDWFKRSKRVFTGGHLSLLEADVEDNAKVLMEMMVQDRLLPISLHMDYNQRPPSRGTKLLGKMMDSYGFNRSACLLIRPDGEQTDDF